jgi:hypothetical protein
MKNMANLAKVFNSAKYEWITFFSLMARIDRLDSEIQTPLV